MPRVLSMMVVAAGLVLAAPVQDALGQHAPQVEQPQPSRQELVRAGQRQFIRCVACHTVTADAAPMQGPHLEGIVGRKVAGLEGFAYSDALRAQDYVWDEARLDRWLEKPHEDVPGLCLPFMGLRRPQDRAALIAYLADPEG